MERDGRHYSRIELAGRIVLTNSGTKPADVEVSRCVLGEVAQVGQEGKVEMVNVLEDTSFSPASSLLGPVFNWWCGNGGSDWWPRFNGISKVSWKVHIEPGKEVELAYQWGYYGL